MLRTGRHRVPVALGVAGTLLLSACTAAGTTVGGPTPAGSPGRSATGPAATDATRTTTTPQAPAPAATITSPAEPGAGTPTLSLAPTASTWAELLIGGTVTTTAAAPSITPTALADSRAAAPRAAARALTTNPVAEPKTVYLTFDDGPSPRYTRQVLDLLKEYDAKATFFVIGRQVRGSGAALVRAEYAAGHGVGNHTWDHHNLRRTKPRTFLREVQRTQRAVKKATGHAPTCLRPPGGAVDKRTRERARELGMKLRMWTVDPSDWRNPKAKTIAARVLRTTHDGSVVLLHDGGGNRARSLVALRVILKTLDARGYTFASLCR